MEEDIIPAATETSPTVRTSFDLSYMQLDADTVDENFRLLSMQDNSEHESDSACASDYEEDQKIMAVYLHHNHLASLPTCLIRFQNLKVLDISNNSLTSIDDILINLTQLKTLVCKHNQLDDGSLPKDFGRLQNLEELNLSGNRFTTLAPQILECVNLKALHLGGNHVDFLPPAINRLYKLELLYLGGNHLRNLPNEIGQLHNLQALILCENELESLPSSLSHLRKLKSLALHKNRLATLPTAIVRLQGLRELSLRDNPLVVRFVRNLDYNPPRLIEIAARCIKSKNVPYTKNDLPKNLHEYLNTAERCVNPKCKGVYFDARIEHIKFVDFCGKYRLPLLQYLCSPQCTSAPAFPRSCSSDSDSGEDDNSIPVSKLKKVLLG